MSWWSSTEAKYHGLVNYGATCYLNSVLQVLFMTEEFREAVNSPDDNRIDRHLKELFEKLPKQTASTRDILNALDVDNVYEQKDAAEYFERILKKTSENAAQIFHGQLTHRTTCLKCQTETNNEGPFWHLPLELGDSCGRNYSVEYGIKTFFTPTTFDGENQMYCEKCNAKVDATTKYVITHHPDVLLLLLKRFDFSYEYMSYIKINCDVDIPHTLKISENQTYELYAVVEHVGDLRGGHYCSIIKPKDEEPQWYTFNDTCVTPNPFLENRNTEKSSGAYLLFYRKKESGMMDHNPCTTQDKTEIPNENSYCMGSRAQNGSNITEMTDEDILDSLSTEVKPEATDPGSGELIESKEITQVKIEIDLQNEESGEQRLKQADEKFNNCKEDSDLSAQISDSKGFNNHSQSSLNQDHPHLDDDPQRRNEMTTDASETQKQERDDDGEASFHRDNSKADDRRESRQKVDQSQITENSVRNKKGQGKKENKDNTISTGKDLSSQRKRKHGDVGEDSQAGTKVRQMEENADNPAQTYNDGNAEDTQKRHTRQKRLTSHETQKKLNLKKTPKYKSYPIRATLTGDHGAERDKETNQQKVQADTSKGSEVAVATGDHSNQSALYFTTVGGDSLDVSANSKGDNEIKIESVQEKSHDSLKRKEMNNDGNGTRGSDHHLLLFAKEEERPVSEPLLPEQQNHTSKEVTREANEDECCVRIVPGAELETLQQEGTLKKISLCKPSVLFLLFLALMCCVLAPLAVWLLCSALLPM